MSKRIAVFDVPDGIDAAKQVILSYFDREKGAWSDKNLYPCWNVTDLSRANGVSSEMQSFVMEAHLNNQHVRLTKSQVDNLIEFIELYFIQSIRDDDGIDNIDYIINMMDALKTLRLASEEMKE